jgi:hypothetical protein
MVNQWSGSATAITTPVVVLAGASQFYEWDATNIQASTEAYINFFDSVATPVLGMATAFYSSLVPDGPGRASGYFTAPYNIVNGLWVAFTTAIYGGTASAGSSCYVGQIGAATYYNP